MLFDAINTNVQIAGQLFLNGEIVIYPTDTIYGIGVDATNSPSILLLNQFKKRETPLSIIVGSVDMLKEYAHVDENILSEIKKLLPGGFTLLLNNNNNSNLSKKITLNTVKIGIRIPKSKFIVDVVNFIGRPIVTTSINYHRQNPINNINTIVEKFNKFHIFRNNNIIKSKGSTILDFTMDEIKLIRKGDETFK